MVVPLSVLPQTHCIRITRERVRQDVVSCILPLFRMFSHSWVPPARGVLGELHLDISRHSASWYQVLSGHIWSLVGLPWWFGGKESAHNAGDVGLIPGSGRNPGEGNGNPLQHSCLGNPMDRGAWRATIHRVTKESDTTEQLNSNHIQAQAVSWRMKLCLAVSFPAHKN